MHMNTHYNVIYVNMGRAQKLLFKLVYINCGNRCTDSIL